jgi:hypothetical protein
VSRKTQHFPNEAELSQAFIVRLWCEPREISGAEPEWRGMILHVSGGEQHFVRALDDICNFIALYAPRMARNRPVVKPRSAKGSAGKRRLPRK